MLTCSNLFAITWDELASVCVMAQLNVYVEMTEMCCGYQSLDAPLPV
jgi:hypothetical protein